MLKIRALFREPVVKHLPVLQSLGLRSQVTPEKVQRASVTHTELLKYLRQRVGGEGQ